MNCSDNIRTVEDDESIRFTCTSYNLVTKTGMSGDQASFISGDKIGVFETLTGRSNVAYTYGTPSWTTSTPMYWMDYGSNHQFYAYYPYNLSNNGVSVSVPVLSAQSISSVPDSNRDMLIAALSQKRSSAVNLSFTHAFALLKFNVSFASGLLGSFLPGKIFITGGNTSGSVSGPFGMFNIVNTINNINYNLSTGKFTYTPNNNTVFQQTISAAVPTLVGGATTIYVLAVPGTYTNPQPYAQFSIKAILGLVELTSTNQSLSVTTLQANTKYEYNVQVIKNILLKGDNSSSPVEVIITPII